MSIKIAIKNALPLNYDPSTIYIVNDQQDGNLVNLFVSDQLGSVAKRVNQSSDSWIYTETSVSKVLVPYEHVIVGVQGLIISLPLTPIATTKVRITVGNFDNTLIARNGSTISGVDEDATISASHRTVTLEYVGSTWVYY